MDDVPEELSDAAYDAELSDSFPASDPPSSTDPARGVTRPRESVQRPAPTEEAQMGDKPSKAGG
jgi:hypothetical protein